MEKKSLLVCNYYMWVSHHTHNGSVWLLQPLKREAFAGKLDHLSDMHYFHRSRSQHKSGCVSLRFLWISRKEPRFDLILKLFFVFFKNNFKQTMHTHTTEPCSLYFMSNLFIDKWNLNYRFLLTSRMRLSWAQWRLLAACSLFIFTLCVCLSTLYQHLLMCPMFSIVSSCFYNWHSMKWVLVSFDQIAICAPLHSPCRKHAQHTWWRLNFPLEYWMGHRWLEFLCASLNNNGRTCWSFREARY